MEKAKWLINLGGLLLQYLFQLLTLSLILSFCLLMHIWCFINLWYCHLVCLIWRHLRKAIGKWEYSEFYYLQFSVLFFFYCSHYNAVEWMKKHCLISFCSIGSLRKWGWWFYSLWCKIAVTFCCFCRRTLLIQRPINVLHHRYFLLQQQNLVFWKRSQHPHLTKESRLVLILTIHRHCHQQRRKRQLLPAHQMILKWSVFTPFQFWQSLFFKWWVQIFSFFLCFRHWTIF